jgi:DNA primase catalytic subunit
MYLLPRGMRFSTLDERRKFYQAEFDLKKIRGWVGKRKGKTIFGVIIGRNTGIFPERYKDDFCDTIVIDEYRDLREVRSMLLNFLPETVYHDRNLYKKLRRCRRCKIAYQNCFSCPNWLGQELAFDLDPENLVCPVHGSFEEKLRRKQGLGFCMLEFKLIRKKTLDLYRELKRVFREIEIVYSGRGFHLYLRDEETRRWSYEERKKFARKISKRFPIDEWVTVGEMRWIRLPFSLHGMVSRIVIPLNFKELARFDPRKDKRCLPAFLSDKAFF